MAALSGFSDVSFKESVVAGTSLSSTAIGMAAKLMQSQGLMGAYAGQLICCAAMIDDVASLILLAMISSLTDSENSDAEWGPTTGVWGVLIPLISSLIFVCLGLLSAHLMPSLYPRLRISTSHVGILLLAVVTAGFVAAAYYVRPTFLLGAFMAGICFAGIPDVVEGFDRVVPPIGTWLSSLFFASIGFEIPAGELFEPEALYYGILLTAIAIVSKVVTGVFAWDLKWLVGWAMVGRGELGCVMAEEASG
eukprot:TRINITY_DN8750_c0_g1_i2.p1 TRINITY_DN8750_c0_g1~~TRINITY_DN8750_c0_g1_i2.p1  ORF type:complete len:250 (+),score=43.70 TRINITY_DN8750_c0_g1_i2:292-1041(+)